MTNDQITMTNGGGGLFSWLVIGAWSLGFRFLRKGGAMADEMMNGAAGAIGAEDHGSLLRSVLRAEVDLEGLERAMGVSLDRVVGWIGSSRAQEALGGLREFSEVQAQLVLSRCRLQ